MTSLPERHPYSHNSVNRRLESLPHRPHPRHSSRRPVPSDSDHRTLRIIHILFRVTSVSGIAVCSASLIPRLVFIFAIPLVQVFLHRRNQCDNDPPQSKNRCEQKPQKSAHRKEDQQQQNETAKIIISVIHTTPLPDAPAVISSGTDRTAEASSSCCILPENILHYSYTNRLPAHAHRFRTASPFP